MAAIVPAPVAIPKIFKCQWTDCPKADTVFNCVEDIVIHVNEDHIPTIVENEDGDREIQCHWNLCETAKSHGDDEKLTNWMKKHFLVIHAKSAKMFKCSVEGCDVKKGTQKELDSHLKNGHKPPKVEKVPKKKKRDPYAPIFLSDDESVLGYDEVWTDPEYEHTVPMDIYGGPMKPHIYGCAGKSAYQYTVLEFKPKKIKKKRGEKLTKAEKKVRRKIKEEKMMASRYRRCNRKIDQKRGVKTLWPTDPLWPCERKFYDEYTEKLEKIERKNQKEQKKNRKRRAKKTDDGTAAKKPCN